MAYLNIRDRVIEIKIAYLGAADSGKATNLKHVRSDDGGRSGTLEETKSGSGCLLSFDWRPHHAAKFNDCEVAVRLVATHGAVAPDALERLVIDSDGVVLVVDSDRAALARNRESLALLRGALARDGEKAKPLVVQINKTDLADAVSLDDLVKSLELGGLSVVSACARTGEGVLPTLQRALAGVIAAIRVPTSEGVTAEPRFTPSASGPRVEGNPLLGALRRILETTTSEHLTRLEERMMARLERQTTASSSGSLDPAALGASLRAIAANVAEIAEDRGVGEHRTEVQRRLGDLEQRMAELEVGLGRFTLEITRDREARRTDLNTFVERVESAFTVAEMKTRNGGRFG